jgi:hypothetical protein
VLADPRVSELDTHRGHGVEQPGDVRVGGLLGEHPGLVGTLAG